MEFKIWRDGDAPAEGLDLGDIEFRVDKKVATTRGDQRLKAMIYISLAELIYGLLNLRDSRRHEFVATDSSFSVAFKKNSADEVEMYFEQSLLGVMGKTELLSAIQLGIDSFLSVPGNRLGPNDLAAADLETSRRNLREALKSRA